MSDDARGRRPSVTVVEPVGRGGLIHYAYQLCRALSVESLEVELVTSRDYELAALPHDFRLVRLFDLWDPKPADEAQGMHPGWRRLRRVARGVRHYREWARLIGRVRRHRPDIVQLGDLRFAADVLPVLGLRRSCTCLVDVCHNIEPFRRSGEFRLGFASRALYRLAYGRFDRVFVHYESNRRRFLRRFPLPPERVHSIPHGNEDLLRELDAGTSTSTLRQRLQLDEGDRIVLFSGALSGYKGIDVLLHAAARLRRSVAFPIRWVVAGYPLPDFDLEAHRRLALRLGIASDVRFVTGYVPSEELGAWMRLADVVALPYRECFQSGVLHLAQTFGVPVVATRTGSFAETIADGRNGLLCEPEDASSLASALARVLGDDVLSGRLARGAERTARSAHSWEGIARILARQYHHLVPGPGVAASGRWREAPR